MKWKLSDFWKQALSSTLGTIIGIVLTFGTSAWINHREKQETERTAALMVIHNLDSFMEQGVKVLRKQTDKCKRLMNVTDEELQQFGLND